MFELAESDPTLAPDAYKREATRLRVALLQAQYAQLAAGKRTLLLVIAGLDGAGRGAAVNLLNEWMDPRHIETLAFDHATRRHAKRASRHGDDDPHFAAPLGRFTSSPHAGHPCDPPSFAAYWHRLPAFGKIGVVFGSWYVPLLREAGRKKRNSDRIDAHVQAIRRFEANLSANGVQVVKLWFHLSRQAQIARTEQLLGDPETAWRVEAADLKVARKFDRLRAAGEETIDLSDSAHAPWIVIPSADERYRSVATGRAVLDALTQRSRIAIAADPADRPALLLPQVDRISTLPTRDKIASDHYEAELAALQARLAHAVRRKRFARKSLVLVFEGQDAAGKGGAIRRITQALDVRQYDISQIAAPSAYELAHPYLWRFWRRLPAPGHVAIFDRSWCGRVLVERVEKLTPVRDWKRAYGEIRDFERQLAEGGAIVLKFWLAVDADEQLARFKEREQSPFKQFKITQDDWRNRAKWKAYHAAANALIAQTDAPHAPWHVIDANDKKRARLDVLRSIVLALEAKR